MTLKQMGYTVIEAVDGLDGLEKLKANPDVSLVFSDYNMPNKNGIEFIKEFKSISNLRAIPVVLLTTESEDEKKAEGRSVGALAWLTKPFKVENIQAVVKKILG
jgi:two-component system chemotaxis response regulator CheY